MLPHPVIVVPGITATYLEDHYPVSPDTVWSVLTKEFERTAMHPSNLDYEAQQPQRIQAGQVFEVAYKELIEELRYNLSPREDRPVPVFPFGYDWRHPLERNEDALDAFIDEVIERTKLLKHYHREGYGDDPKVNLIGHSMGGLIIAGHLARKGIEPRVHKVATLATPFRGSFEAGIKVITGTAHIGSDKPSSRERESARMTPALYYLLADRDIGLKIDQGLPNSIFKVDAWQPQVSQSIGEWIRKHGLPSEGSRKEEAQALLKGMLDRARKHRQLIDRWSLSDSGLTPERWLAVVGVDCETRTQMSIAKIGSSPSFKLTSRDRRNTWGKQDEDWSHTGDGTVSFKGAVPPFLEWRNLVCIRPEDYGTWEWQDRALSSQAGFHGILPNMNMLHRMLVRYFKDATDRRSNTWGCPAPGVSKADWAPPFPMRAAE